MSNVLSKEMRPQFGIIRPYDFKTGGYVHKHMDNIPLDLLPPNDKDTVYARLMPHEIVIPVKHAPLIKKFLKKENIKLPGL